MANDLSGKIEAWILDTPDWLDMYYNVGTSGYDCWYEIKDLTVKNVGENSYKVTGNLRVDPDEFSNSDEGNDGVPADSYDRDFDLEDLDDYADNGLFDEFCEENGFSGYSIEGDTITFE